MQRIKSTASTSLPPFFDSAVLGTKIYLDDLEDLLLKHRLQLREEIEIEFNQLNRKVTRAEFFFSKNGHLPDYCPSSDFSGMKIKRRNYGALLAAIDGLQKLDLYKAKEQRLDQRDSILNRRQRVFHSVLIDYLCDQFGKDEVIPLVEKAGKVAEIVTTPEMNRVKSSLKSLKRVSQAPSGST